MLIKAYAYIARLGDDGLSDASAKAVLNANYLASQIDYEVPFSPFHHEFVASAGDQDAADVAKRMLDYGVHPPTTKWPEIVSEALMTEPTEIENRETLDELADAFNAVIERGRRDARSRTAEDHREAHRPSERGTEPAAFVARAGRLIPLFVSYHKTYRSVSPRLKGEANPETVVSRPPLASRWM